MPKKKDVLVVGSKVKRYIKSKKMMCSGDLLEGLNECMYSCIDEAIKRTKNNKRATVRKYDV